MTWLNWSLKFHFRLKTIPHLIHTQHTRLLFNEYLFYLCDCTCSNMMCILNFLSIKPKKIFEFFKFFFNVFESVFMLSCFEFLFKLHLLMFFIKKSLRGIFVRSSWLSSSHKNGLGKKWKHKISDKNSHDYFTSKDYLRKILCFRGIFRK